MRSILALPQDNQTWRIDWFGDVLYQRHYRYAEPYIRIALSRVTLSASDEWDYPARFGYLDDQTHAVVPVGVLGMLSIGSIWQNGYKAATPEYTQECFTVTGHHETAPLIKAGAENDEGSFMLPFETHPYHRAHTRSYCIQTVAGDGIRLIIPVTELIRFYFGSSGGLLARLFQAPFGEHRLWTRAEIDERGHAVVDLTKGLSGYSAADVARIAFDPCARHAAKMISSSLLSVTDPDNKAYPKMLFPFVGKSDLWVKGIWVGERCRDTFLAFQILSCTHRFPFLELKYSMTRRQARLDGSDGAESGHHIQRRNRSGGDVIVRDAPDSQRAARKAPYMSESRFPDLDRKPVARADPISPVRVVITESGESVVASGTGDGEGKTGVRPIDPVAAEAAPAPKGHPLEGGEFAKYVDEVVRGLLLQRKRVWFVPLDPRQRYPQFSVMPEIVRDGGEIHPMSYVAEQGKSRPRYVSILRVHGPWPMETKVWLIPEGVLGITPEKAVMKFSIDNDEQVTCEWLARRIQQQGIEGMRSSQIGAEQCARHQPGQKNGGRNV